MRITRLLAAASAATVIAVLTASPALAHNSLTKAVPDKNATVTERPEQVQLSFLQKVDPKFLTIVVTDAQKNKVPMDAATADGKTGTATFSQPLVNGVYTVAYRVVSQDGHPVQGSYTFTLDDPAATPSPSATPSSPPTPQEAAPSTPAVETVPLSSEDTDDGLGWGPIIAIIAGVLVVGGVALFALRRRKTV
jgi:copper resistance protein C